MHTFRLVIKLLSTSRARQRQAVHREAYETDAGEEVIMAKSSTGDGAKKGAAGGAAPKK